LTAQAQVIEVYEAYAEEFLHYALALSHDEQLAQDALQEAFMRYFVALSKHQEIGSPRAWIYRVLHNYVLDRRKEERRWQEHRSRGSLGRLQYHDMECEYFHNEFAQLVRSALTAREYDCFRLRAEGMRYGEIAAALQLTSGAVGTLVSRAVHKLRALMVAERRIET
jgi:RNA polymerase sigma-70 factor (ECF subfamily)